MDRGKELNPLPLIKMKVKLMDMQRKIRMKKRDSIQALINLRMNIANQNISKKRRSNINNQNQINRVRIQLNQVKRLTSA